VKNLLCLLLALSGLPSFGAETHAPAPTDDRMAWWREARFGMFIHYGPVTLTGQEISWSRANSNTNCPNKGKTPVDVYDNLYKEFNPTNFNAPDWAGVAKMAGMKYVVLTAKHCDGFLLWDSKVDGYNVMATPFKRDLCAELANAVRKDDLHLGWYFSPMDWRDPDCRSADNARFVTKMQGELRELLSNYGKVDVLWFDSDGRPAVWDAPTTYALVRGLQPQIIINNRLEMGTQVEWLKQGHLRENEDYYTPEQRIGGYDDQHPWETCMTVCRQWSWKPDDTMKTPAEVVNILCRVVGGDGNLLLNVGPMPDGRIEPRQVEVLKQVGAWMHVNGESIYGTRGGPWKPSPAVTSTRKGSTVYVHVLKTDGDIMELPALLRKIKSASMLGGGEIKTEAADGKIILHLPEKRDPLATVIKLELDGSAMTIAAIALPAPKPAFATLKNNFAVSAARVQRLQDLRWGMFICWSFSTFSGKEWTPGVTDLDLFAAKDCETDQWAKTAKDAGMGYILFLAKHHDGFCLWDTQTTDRKVTRAPLGRDVLAELRKSCDKYGIKLALYFSEGEWAWPDFPDSRMRMNHGGYNPELKKAQLRELLTHYGAIEYIWFDHAVGDGGLSHGETAQWVKQLQPDCFVGFNHGEAGGDIRLGEMGRPGPVKEKTGIGADAGDTNYSGYRLAEFTYPILPKHKGGAMWFYSLPEHDHLCLSAEKIYADYLGAVKFGNVFSLDVGPDYRGRLRAIDVETLHQVGEMIRTNAPAPALDTIKPPRAK
jgi:alpha-L-fucosidase